MCVSSLYPDDACVLLKSSYRNEVDVVTLSVFLTHSHCGDGEVIHTEQKTPVKTGSLALDGAADL